MTRISDEQTDRHQLHASVVPTGNPWLDDALAGGLNRRNLMLVAAKTGVGKTFFGVQLARFAAREHRRVLYFALEAEEHEIERRMLYYELTRLIAKHMPALPIPRYREWLHEGYTPEWHSLEGHAQKLIERETEALEVLYKTELYTPEQFRRDVAEIVEKSDPDKKPQLVIVDHLHHFFLSSSDENQELKSVIHSIKRLHDRYEVPVVILAQLRKNDGGFQSKRTLPMLEDIRGTAALSDVATDVLIISPFPSARVDELPADFHNPMFFHLAKSRTAAETRQFAGVVSFDAKLGQYAEQYALYQTKLFEDPEVVEPGKIPKWAKRARRPKVEVRMGRDRYAAVERDL